MIKDCSTSDGIAAVPPLLIGKHRRQVLLLLLTGGGCCWPGLGMKPHVPQPLLVLLL
jgi:hypothetical protein